ncbi:hypothetical protein BDP27DRAFT_1319557 [Rhodocollybia butyracea]|uniref:F-box domain-containing protein n=1 Tax=Rhodocollybia butyracea TaxID=206335 RepID=A0A9P5PZP9_9AGAR|nr:hypothetical protein BDP27DRAFT_1319557 [Rhodocollybia butyracea]
MLFLLSQCDRLEQRKLSLQSLSSLVHRLPNEIVTKIFTSTCVENNLQCAKVTPLIIAATCARWRELAVSCPKLWSCFDIHLRRENYPPQASARLDIFLQRSKNHCLTLFITYYNRLPLDSNNYFLQQLLQHSDRWQHVTFNVTRFSFENFPGLRAAVLPRLETVKLTHEDINPEDKASTSIRRGCA